MRTIIDLRNADERPPHRAPRPTAISTLEIPLDGIEDTEFWDRWSPEPPPLYYGPFLERLPERAAIVLARIAEAPPGGVLLHCVGGRDRTGLIAMLVLAIAGVAPRDVAADHALSDERLSRLYAWHGVDDQGVEIAEELARRQTTAAETIVSTLNSAGTEARLQSAGLGHDTFSALRARLLGD